MKRMLSVLKMKSVTLAILVVFVMQVLLVIPCAASSASNLKSVTAITEIFGDGQKVSAVAIEYDKNINNSKLKSSDFSVDGRIVTNVYANTTAAKSTPVPAAMGAPATQGVDGNYVIIELSTADTNASTIEYIGQGPSVTSKRGTVKVSVKQIGNIVTTDGIIYEPSSTIQVNSKEIDVMVDSFKQLVFTDDNFPGETLMYNLYVPQNYDKKKLYPLVLFMPDASATSDDPEMTLIQGLGAQIWATPSEQAKHECFVLAPQYTVKNTQASRADITYALLESIQSQYSIDKNRLYTTGQSAGCITSIALDVKYPDLFAASYLVAGQYDATKVSPLAKQNIWIVVSAGDIQAFPGMNAITAILESDGGKVSREIWDGQSTTDDFVFEVSKMVSEDSNIKYTVLQKGTVVATGLPNDPPHNHMGTWAIAYSIEGIRDWLFTQVKTDGYSAQELYNLGFKDFQAGDYKTAVLYFEKAAEMGNTSATEMIGDAYQSGKGVAIDYAKAAEWNQKAIDLGSARACNNLGVMYMDGLGFKQDYTKALGLFEQATKNGDFKGPRYVGIIYFNGYVDGGINYEKAAEYFKLAADGGDTTANYYLGLMYEKGLVFVQDYAEAIEFYEKAAPITGHAESSAMVSLGRIYENGLGVEKDINKAIGWYKKAAELGNNDAKTAIESLNAN